MLQLLDYQQVYDNFQAPIAKFDCGKKCAPYNPGGKPFCCDTSHAVPTAYNAEWDYLKNHTDLWHRWNAEDTGLPLEEAHAEIARLHAETPSGMVLIACLGPERCQREYRALTCRQFPFFPYIDSDGEFIGLSYYWDYEEVCWVISNLHIVEPDYRQQFIESFELIFQEMPEELRSYKYYSEEMRDVYNQKRRAIPLLHRNGHAYKISTHNERMRRVPLEKMPKFGPYKLAAKMPFPDEIV